MYRSVHLALFRICERERETSWLWCSVSQSSCLPVLVECSIWRHCTRGVCGWGCHGVMEGPGLLRLRASVRLDRFGPVNERNRGRGFTASSGCWVVIFGPRLSNARNWPWLQGRISTSERPVQNVRGRKVHRCLSFPPSDLYIFAVHVEGRRHTKRIPECSRV